MSTVDRRTFFRLGGAFGAASLAQSALPVQAAENKPAPPKILNQHGDMPYRRMGETDVHLSVIAMGGLVMNDKGESHLYAIDRGCNTIHLSRGYLGGKSLKVLGELMKTKRDKVYIMLKDDFFSDDDYKSGNLDKIDGTLRDLNTDHVDFLMFNRHKADEAANPYLREAFLKLKEKGKVRYMGLTTHGDIKNVMQAAVDSGFYDLLNPVLNQPALEMLDAQLNAARAKKIAVMGMKTMKGIDDREREKAYLKKVLAHPGVTNIVKGINSQEQFDDYLAAARTALTMTEDRDLYRHGLATRGSNCMMCDECRQACPYGVRISTVLRCIDYYLGEQGDRATATSTYAGLAAAQRWNAVCGTCRLCEEVCPNNIRIVERLDRARLALA